METISQKRLNNIDEDHHNKRKKINAQSSSDINDSPITGTRITDWEEYEKWKEVRGDIEPTMNYVEITPEAIEELSKIKNIIGDYICQLCKVKYENAFALAMHKCPRVVHIEFRCPECDKTFNCPANLASHRRWHKPQTSTSTNEPSNRASVSNRNPRCSSRSDSRSTNTSASTSTNSETNFIHEYLGVSSSILDSTKMKSPINSNAKDQKTTEHILRTVYNTGVSRLLPSSFQTFSTSFIKHPTLFAHHRPVPIPMPTSFDARRLQSSCIFCQEQFSELSHLLQHIRKNHAVSSDNNKKNNPITLDKIVF